MTVGWTAIAFASAVLAQPQPSDTTSAAAASPAQVQHAGGPVVITIHDENIAAPLGSIEAGELTVNTSPPRKLALDEISRIELGGAPGFVLAWIGQDNHDLVQAGSAGGGNGIQDMHLRLTGLPASRKIKQIIAVCHYQGQVRVWRLDPAQTPHWKIELQRAEGTSMADLYLEPTGMDSFDQEFSMTVTYDDGSTAKVVTKATTHATDQVKVSEVSKSANDAVAKKDEAAKEPSNKDSSTVASETVKTMPEVIVHLEGQNSLHGSLASLVDESLALNTTWSAQEVKIPLLQVQGVWFGASSSSEARQLFNDRLKKPATEDTAIILGKDQTLSQVSGRVEGLADKQLRFAYEGETRSINLARLVAVVFAAHPPQPNDGQLYEVFHFVNGDKLPGHLTAIGDETLDAQTAWAGSVKLPRADVFRITFRNGRLVYLSDLEPVNVEEIPYFSRKAPYHRDENLLGAPLKMKGTNYSKGLAVHSRSLLTYALDGQFETFEALAGFDDETLGRGRVACRVLGDGKDLLSNPDLRADQGPLPIHLSIRGVKQLTLEVDFGQEEDTLDRVIWANARIFKASAK